MLTLIKCCLFFKSDGHSVRELLPVLKLLYQTTRNDVSDDKENLQVSVLRNQINAKVCFKKLFLKQKNDTLETRNSNGITDCCRNSCRWCSNS